MDMMSPYDCFLMKHRKKVEGKKGNRFNEN